MCIYGGIAKLLKKMLKINTKNGVPIKIIIIFEANY